VGRNVEVDAWFERYENPMKPVVERIRAFVLAADRRIDECIKWQAPTFTYRGNLASFFPKSKQHASLMFHTGAQIPGDHPLLEGGGDVSRIMKIGTVAEANAGKREIERVVRAWCDWRDSVESRGAGRVVRTKASGGSPKRTAPGIAAASSSKGTGGGYDEKTAERIRSVLAGRADVVEKRMFGGLCFMVNGQMCCGLTKTDFMVRVGKDAYDDALAQPHARPMDFTGRPLASMVYVAPEAIRSATALAKWVGRGVSFVSSLPPKAARRSTAKTMPEPKGATPPVRAPARDPRVGRLLRTLRSDRKLAPIIDAFEKTKPGARKFGSNGLKVDGRLFALFTQGTLVVKLPKDRVAALVASGVGKPFDPGHGRLMKGWLTVTSTKAAWIDLAKEAHGFVSGRVV
jgi:TfoX/Sxy family transcriptional regulator of competence genes